MTTPVSPCSSIGEREGLLESRGSASGVESHVVKDDLAHFKKYIEVDGATGGGWRGDMSAQ